MRRPGSIAHVKKQLRRIIYRLKWVYGFPADLYRETQGELDTESGQRVVTKSKIRIDRMIVMPGLIHRDFFFSISVIRANSQFITGGDIELSDRQFIIDGRDLPFDYRVDIDDYIIKEGEKWTFNKVEALEEGTGYFINARRLQNEIVTEIKEDYIRTNLTVTSEFSVGT